MNELEKLTSQIGGCSNSEMGGIRIDFEILSKKSKSFS